MRRNELGRNAQFFGGENLLNAIPAITDAKMKSG
jgi:hypothetical protein